MVKERYSRLLVAIDGFNVCQIEKTGVWSGGVAVDIKSHFPAYTGPDPLVSPQAVKE